MFKVLLLGIGFAVAYLAVMAGEYLSPLIMTGSMPLAVAGISLPANVVQVAYYASLVVAALGTIFTVVATIGYIVNWFFSGWQNPNTIPAQITFLMLVLAESLFGFGAVAKPFSLYGNSPLDWLGSPYLWLLVAAFVPSVFLLMNLVVEAIQWHLRPSPLEREIKTLLRQVGDLQGSVNSINMGAVYSNLDSLLRSLGWSKDDKGQWGPPGTTASYKLATLLESLGCTFDDAKKEWRKPEKNLSAAIEELKVQIEAISARLPPPQPHVVADNAPKAPETKVA